MNSKEKIQIVVIDQANRLLLLQTNKERGSFLQNITGSVEPGESIWQAAQRELREEISLDIPLIDLKSSFSFSRDNWTIVEHLFLARPHSNVEIILSDEHSLFKWINVESVQRDNYKFASNYDAFLQAKAYLV